ncbi:hypothetical protein VC83_04712 [Pseudogymnoascus destructans]|uniref:Histone H1 n=2 Tax=Pseudogymnoascus destructans TaxID=655981 RepID=L8FTM1_PSED2|nr:uncharacterized protein VC83_04712 [Pseudogymnoascus destructans]ELR03833.1 hypothetical protein GMDG_01362 [Pseudogymnoascus destructans 20631-21]OAF57294.1 hypothetical protein VC83_04712 [Pseudogymnoascus destructans]
MPPKKTESGAGKKSTSAGHSYQDMIKDAIINLKERNGSSRVALKKYVKANNNINATDKMFDSLFNKALKSGVEKGEFNQPKGSSGGTKLAKKEPKPAAKPAAKKATAPAKKAAPKTAAKPKAAATKKTVAKPKAAAPKKAAPKKPAAKKAAPKKDVPAIVEKPTVLGKTKSGRVTKTTAKTPVAKKAAPKKPAAKKATA